MPSGDAEEAEIVYGDAEPEQLFPVERPARRARPSGTAGPWAAEAGALGLGGRAAPGAAGRGMAGPLQGQGEGSQSKGLEQAELEEALCQLTQAMRDPSRTASARGGRQQSGSDGDGQYGREVHSSRGEPEDEEQGQEEQEHEQGAALLGGLAQRQPAAGLPYQQQQQQQQRRPPGWQQHRLLAEDDSQEHLADSKPRPRFRQQLAPVNHPVEARSSDQVEYLLRGSSGAGGGGGSSRRGNPGRAAAPPPSSSALNPGRKGGVRSKAGKAGPFSLGKFAIKDEPVAAPRTERQQLRGLGVGGGGAPKTLTLTLDGEEGLPPLGGGPGAQPPQEARPVRSLFGPPLEPARTPQTLPTHPPEDYAPPERPCQPSAPPAEPPGAAPPEPPGAAPPDPLGAATPHGLQQPRPPASFVTPHPLRSSFPPGAEAGPSTLPPGPSGGGMGGPAGTPGEEAPSVERSFLAAVAAQTSPSPARHRGSVGGFRSPPRKHALGGGTLGALLHKALERQKADLARARRKGPATPSFEVKVLQREQELHLSKCVVEGKLPGSCLLPGHVPEGRYGTARCLAIFQAAAGLNLLEGSWLTISEPWHALAVPGFELPVLLVLNASNIDGS